MLYYNRMVSPSVYLVVRLSSGPRDQFFAFFSLITFRQLRVCWCREPSLTRGPVCSFHLWLDIARAVFLGSEPYGTHEHTSLSLFLKLPQPGGPGSCTYFHQEQGGPVIPPGTGFPFRRLSRLAGLRRRYSNPPPHEVSLTILLPAFDIIPGRTK
jgi:hypothetical protein